MGQLVTCRWCSSPGVERCSICEHPVCLAHSLSAEGNQHQPKRRICSMDCMWKAATSRKRATIPFRREPMNKKLARALLACAVAPWLSAAGNTFGGIGDVDTAAKTLTVLCPSLSAAVDARQLTLKIDAASTATIYCGPSTVTNVPANARVQISVAGGIAYTWQPGNSRVNTDDIYCCASANNTVSYCDGVQ